MNYANIATELKAAKALIDTPAKWAKEAYGTDANGNVIGSMKWADTPPACMCSLGAIIAVHIANGTFNHTAHSVTGDTAQFLDNLMEGETARYNDSHTHAEVMAKWDEAIKLAEVRA